eukprot:scaffold2313_cov100-Isochrysis_galbana.AAC.5
MACTCVWGGGGGVSGLERLLGKALCGWAEPVNGGPSRGRGMRGAEKRARHEDGGAGIRLDVAIGTQPQWPSWRTSPSPLTKTPPMVSSRARPRSNRTTSSLTARKRGTEARPTCAAQMGA